MAFMAVVLAVTVSACGGDNDEPDNTGKGENTYETLILGKWMLPSDWGEAYYFKSNGTAIGYETDYAGNLKDTWDNTWVIRGDMLYITENYDDISSDDPDTSVYQIINITATRAILRNPESNETITCSKVSKFPWE